MRKNNLLSTRWLIVFGLAALVAATLFATGAFLRTATAVTPRYVDPAGTDAGTCTPIGSACATISFAIGVSAAGDTINVAAGTYAVASVINVNVANLTISGDKGTTVVDGSGKNGSIVDGQDVLFNVSASGVTIEDLNIDLGDDTSDFDVGIFTPNDASVGTLTVRNNTMRFGAFDNATGEQLIHLGGGTGNMVEANDLETASSNSTIYVGDNTNVALTIQDNTIAPVSDADGGGTAINSFGPVTATSTISGNTFTKTGIAVWLGADFYGSTTATDGVDVTGNAFTDTTSVAWGAVVIAAEVDGTATSNITVTGNSFNGSAGDAVLVQDFGATGDVDASTVDINYNDFDGTNGGGVSVVGVTGDVDAEKNWWGDVTGADHASNPHGTGQGGDTASNNVDFTPWYATGTTTPGTENVTVTHNPIIAVSDTIQGAIDAALAGDTVDASAGTYPEYLQIDKDNLTLQGAGIDQTIIDLDGVTPYNQFASGYSVGGILVSGWGTTNDRVYGVTIRDLTVQNAGVNSGTGWTGARDDDSNGDGDVSGIDIVSGYDVSVIDSKIINSTRHGIHYDRPVNTGGNPRWHSMNAVVTGSTVSNNAFSGIQLGFFHGSVDISGNTVENNVKSGIYVRGGKDKGDGTVKYATGSVTGNQVHDNASWQGSYGGIFVRNQSTDIDVSGNTVTGHNKWSESFGIMASGEGASENTGTLIHDNIVTGNIRSIIGFYGATGGKIYDNTITTDSGLFDTGQAAVKLDGVSGFEVYDNSLSSLSGIGIILNNWGDWAGVPASHDNLVYRNTIDAPRFAGIYVKDLAYDNTFTNNEIKNAVSETVSHNNSWGQHDGGADQTMLTDSTATWTPGHFVGWTVLNLSDGSEGTITANTATTITATLAGGTENDWDNGDWYDLWFDVTRQVGIYLEGGDSYAGLHAGTGNLFNYNSIHDNAGGGIDNEIATTVDASANWWGTATPAGVAGEVAGPVDYTPWIHDGTDQDLVTKGYQPDLSNLHVDDDSPQTGATGRVQEGIDLVTGSTVNVEAGTYAENVIVTKPLTIAGAGQASTTIIPAVSNPNPCAGSSLCGSATAASNVILTQASDVIIHDLTVDGDNTSLTSGIVRAGADLDARNGIVENYYAGVYDNLEIYNVTVKNIYLRAIYASSGGTGFNIHDNVVQNVRGEVASIAIMNWGGVGTIADNTVDDASDAIVSNHSSGTSTSTTR